MCSAPIGNDPAAASRVSTVAVAGATATKAPAQPVAPTAVAVDTEPLPFTGTAVTGLVGLAIALLGGGLLLAWRRRRI